MLYLVNTEYTLSADYVPPDLVRPGAHRLWQPADAKRSSQGAGGAVPAAKDEEGFILKPYPGTEAMASNEPSTSENSVHGRQGQGFTVGGAPGASEHQLGLAMDIGRKGGSGLTARFGDTKEGQWVAQNAHRFGYIIRYKEEWTAITGYAYEPWHIRYVGKEHAGRLFELDIPLDTYVAMLSEAAFGAYLGSEGE